MRRIFLADLDQLRTMIEWIRHSLIPMEFSASELRKIELASEEALVNIIRHAYSNRPEEIEIEVKPFAQSHVEIAIKDRGPPFNPLEQGPPDLDASLEERQIGGLGIHLIRQNMDEVLYAREKDANILTLVKKRR